MVYELGHVRDQFNNKNVVIQKEGVVASNLHKKRRSGVNNVNKFIGDVAKNYMETTVGENWPSELINHLNTRFPTSIDSIKNYIRQDANLHQKVSNTNSSLPDLLVSPVFQNTTESYMNLGYNYNHYNHYNQDFFGGSSFNKFRQNNITTNGNCNGMNLKQTDLEDLITSPEQVSSITACSYGDLISDTEAFDSRNYYQLKSQSQTQSMQLQLQQPQQQQQHVILESSCQISSFQVLNSYIMYKDMPQDLKREVPFQNYMHASECKENFCNCSMYIELASHFDKCHDVSCNICGPVRSLYSNGNFESKKRKIELVEDELHPISYGDPNHTGTLSDALPTKYQKVEEIVCNEDVQEVEKEVLRVDFEKKGTEDDEQRKDFHQTVGGRELTEVKQSDVSNNEIEKLPEKMKIQSVSVSLADFFTADQIRGHLLSFTHEKDATGNRVQSIGQNRCQLCTMDKLVFAPSPIYCSSCDTRIKRNVGYFRSTNEIGIRHCFCMSCYRGSHGTNIIMRGFSILKSNLQKTKNDEQKEDSWVLCDRCQCWQHRICGLYNDEKDVEGKSEYICPKCYLEEIENGTRVPLPETNAFGAEDLPKTNLSDHIEQRLYKRLNEEREEMAKNSGIEPNQVPIAEGLVVRVVVSVEKQLEVRQKFKDILHGEDYPSGFTYRSKLIFLFQKIEGVDVCLFGMCVQEFGSECVGPNQRCVYISYLDSVKYFRPERKTVTGESLRTFVYHEILIGYLEYCKTRGFATCYIWACPLIKGEDYIFYCHPETQRTPKQDKLRQWYKSMLKKGAEDGVVVDYTNFYNKFFVANGEGNTKITAARLPFFDGDFWSGQAENIVRKLEVEERNGGGLQSKLPNKRILKAMGQDKPDVAVKDVLVMQKLGQTILPVKENFMIVHLQHACTNCHEVILSGSRWFCSHCKKIQLCSRCFISEMHTCHSGEKNLLSEVVVNNVTVDTTDKDDIFVNSFFETRDAFLNKCQKSHFQFDTLSRAKYSSMMILYHLIHKPPPIKPTCTACHKDVVVERCWHCDTCTKYNVCESCYKMKRGAYHPHRLNPPSVVTVRRSKKTMTLKEVLDVLMHASECVKIPCCYTECVTMRRLFYHASRCNVRVPGGCQFCERVWRILKEHSQRCKDSDCRIPRCMDIKKHKEVKANQESAMKEVCVGRKVFSK